MRWEFFWGYCDRDIFYVRFWFFFFFFEGKRIKDRIHLDPSNITHPPPPPECHHTCWCLACGTFLFFSCCSGVDVTPKPSRAGAFILHLKMQRVKVLGKKTGDKMPPFQLCVKVMCRLYELLFFFCLHPPRCWIKSVQSNNLQCPTPPHPQPPLTPSGEVLNAYP